MPDSVLFGNRFATQEVPSREFPETGMTALDAMRLVSEDLVLEGDPARNLATSSTWMEPEAQRIIAENHRNFIDHAEYPRGRSCLLHPMLAVVSRTDETARVQVVEAIARGSPEVELALRRRPGSTRIELVSADACGGEKFPSSTWSTQVPLQLQMTTGRRGLPTDENNYCYVLERPSPGIRYLSASTTDQIGATPSFPCMSTAPADSPHSYHSNGLRLSSSSINVTDISRSPIPHRLADLPENRPGPRSTKRTPGKTDATFTLNFSTGPRWFWRSTTTALRSRRSYT
jgi:hypothetical protein